MDWPHVVDTLPKALADAIAVYEEAGYAQRPDTRIDESSITVENAGQVIMDLAETLAAEASTPFDDAAVSVDGHGPSATIAFNAANSVVKTAIVGRHLTYRWLCCLGDAGLITA